ncbi:MAG: 16S rRNA (cytosine(1402)-N(4))-methyltransferase RsmH [Candidatus Thioglobus sp.]|nr:16S rRNA (cytosine(1402)-N(4))-methyltransferase RsmH [Candidatus Thioglobus sp.]
MVQSKSDSAATSNHHSSVMFSESIEGLNIRSDGIYVDATFGRGGHTKGMLDCLGESGRVIAFDQDIDAVDYAKSNFKDSRLSLLHANFSKLVDELDSLNLTGEIDGILMDLGISSPQLDNADRGFSFNSDGPLDMRMNQTQGLTAAEWLKQTSEGEIADALYLYGEEKRSRIIAATIKKYQQNKDINSTTELANLITTVARSGKKKHPATRSFQAIRIVINDELKQLTSALEQSIDILAPKGRLCVISFHSIEDRIVKQFIRKHSRPKETPKGLPVISKDIDECLFNDLGKLKPTKNEVESNRRSRSAILRLAEKC